MLPSDTAWAYIVWFLFSVTVLALPRVDFAPASSFLSAREDDSNGGEDVTDLSFIEKMAAIGDSYSAGIGAGERLGTVLDREKGSDWTCSRYNQAYPYLINYDYRLGENPEDRDFQFLSCSGAVIQDVVDEQIPELTDDQQVIMLSAGGNDVGLTDILNQCIYQWLAFNDNQETVGKIAKLKAELSKSKKTPEAVLAMIDWDKYSLGCTGALAQAASIVESDGFAESLDSLLEAAKKKLSSDGVIYYTGYGQFFDSTTSECDDVTWTIWIRKAYNLFQEDEYLSSSKREVMNELVLSVNEKLKEAVDRAGDQVEFVDYDVYIRDFRGRFCERGVNENIKEANDRHEHLFYRLDTWDVFGNTPWKREVHETPNGTFEGNMHALAHIAQEADPDATLAYADYFEDDDEIEAQIVKGAVFQESDDGVITVPNVLPDGYGRVFHPQIALHTMIANLVIFRMTNRQAEAAGDDPVPETWIPRGSECSRPQLNTPPSDARCYTDLSEEECKEKYECPEGLKIGCVKRNWVSGAFACTCYEDRSGD